MNPTKNPRAQWLLLALLVSLTAFAAISLGHLGEPASPSVEDDSRKVLTPTEGEEVEVSQEDPQTRSLEVDPQANIPRIEAVFVLDTTGSMGGLIEGAKQKIWSIANRLLDGTPQPEVRLGLVGYRDRGDEYVTRRQDLTDDVDTVYAQLRAFQAHGGGDTPESVNQALHEAVTLFDWSEDPSVYRVIFLVGDAPPKQYPDDVPYRDSLAMAQDKGILVNTIQCGNHGPTQQVWAEIASFGQGQFTAIAQSGGMVATSTPMDAELSRLNRLVAKTMVAWGDRRQRHDLRAKQKRAVEAGDSVASERLSYLSKKGGKVNSGRSDLVDALENGEVAFEELDRSALPAELQSYSQEELKGHLAEQSRQRRELQRQIRELVESRDAYLRESLKESAEREENSFDAQVVETLRVQAKAKGIDY